MSAARGSRAPLRALYTRLVSPQRFRSPACTEVFRATSRRETSPMRAESCGAAVGAAASGPRGDRLQHGFARVRSHAPSATTGRASETSRDAQPRPAAEVRIP